MEKNLYIDASLPNETRIVLKSNSSIEEYEFENKNNLNFKNNIYLGTVSRVEPSLQAAFINFGRDRHGLLAFNDIQSDYYQIPSEDKEKIKEAESKLSSSIIDNNDLSFEFDRLKNKEESEVNSKDLPENTEKTINPEKVEKKNQKPELSEKNKKTETKK